MGTSHAFKPSALPGPRKAAPRNPDLLDLNQVAYRIGVSRRTLERRIATGQLRLPIYNVEGRIYARASEIEPYMKSRLVGRWGPSHDV